MTVHRGLHQVNLGNRGIGYLAFIERLHGSLCTPSAEKYTLEDPGGRVAWFDPLGRLAAGNEHAGGSVYNPRCLLNYISRILILTR